MPRQISREDYERLSPYDKWIHRMQFGEPAGGAPAKLDSLGNTFIKKTVPALAESAAGVFPGIALSLAGREKASVAAPPLSNYGEAFGLSGSEKKKAPQAPKPTTNVAAESSKPLTLAELLGGRSVDSFAPQRPATQPNRADAMRFGARPDLLRPTVKQEQKQRVSEQRKGILQAAQAGELNMPSTEELYQQIQSGPAPTWKSPEETMIDTHMDNQRSIISRNNEQREGRRSYIPNEAEARRQTAGRLRNKQTGQVDPLAFGGGLGGGRGDMLIALAGRKPAEDLSSVEGRREAFGSVAKVGNVAPYAGGTTTDPETGERTRSAQRERMLDRKQAVAEYNAKRLGAGASGTAAAAEGKDIEQVLAGLPPSAQRGARRAFMAEQQRQLGVEAQEKLIKAGQPKEDLNDPNAERRKQMMILMLDPNADPATREWAAREYRRMDAAQQGFNTLNGGF